MEHGREDPERTAEPTASVPSQAAGASQAKLDELLGGRAQGLSPANLMALQRAAGNQSVLGLLRSVAPPTGRGLARRDDHAAATGSGLRIVADDAEAGDGRISQGGFLDAVEGAVREVAERELAGTIFTSQGCPWIAHWMAYYRERTAAEVQAAVEQYAPTAATAADLDGALAAISDRLAEGIASWRATDAIPDVAPPTDHAPTPTAGPMQALMRESRRSSDPRSVQAELGPGRPLDPAVASRVGPLLGADLSQARVHTDEPAGQVAARHGAAAITVGSHVAFARGAYEPGTPLGDALIAHELAHVAQYDETPGAPVASTRAAEDEAVAASFAAVAQGGLRGAAMLRRSVRSGLALRSCGSKTWPTTPGVHGVAPETMRPGFDRDGNVPGQLSNVVDDSGTHRFSFDADGDQAKELSADIKTVELYASGAAKRVTVGLTQLSSKARLVSDFNLPDVDKGGGSPSVAIADVSDGSRPTKVILTLPAGGTELHIQPAKRFATQVQHRVDLVTHAAGPTSPTSVLQKVDYTFPAETSQINEVFTTANPSKEPDAQGPVGFQQVGHLWKLDVAVGAYGDRFRMTFRRVRAGASTVEMGLSVLAKAKGSGPDDEDVALAGHKITLEVSTGALAPTILKTDPTRLVLDLDDDGRADVIVHDRLTLRAGATDGGEKDRDHELTIAGPAVRLPRRFGYPVRDGYIKAGEQKGLAADFSGASDTHAAGSLPGQVLAGVYDEKKGQILGELISTERTLAALRVTARDEKLISETLYTNWSQAEWDFAALAAYESGTPPQDLVDSVNQSAVAFFDQLETESKRGEQDKTGADDAIVATKNPFTGTQKEIIWPGGSKDVRGPFLAKLKAGDWKGAGKTYRDLVDGLDRWVAFVNREKYGDPDEDTPESHRALVGERLSGLRNKLRELEPKRPTRVAAVLHTDEYFEHMGDVQEIPLSMYYWKEDGDWYVKDLTTPDETPHWDVPAKPGETEPPKRLFDELDDNDHFPKGWIHWMLPSGAGGRTRTTGPSTIKRWATYIGVAAAAIGLGLATFGTGTVAVAGGYILAGSAVMGAATAAYDLYDKGTHGTLEPGAAILDVAQIASAVTGLAALRFGRILANVRTASAAGSAVEATTAIQLAQRAYVPVRLAQGASDVVTLAVMSAELEKNVDRINKSQMSEPERNRALALLFTQFAFTGGLTALSVKGLMPEMVGRGQDIAIVRYGDKEFAIPKGVSQQGQAINESVRKLGDAPDPGAQQPHLDTVGKIGGKPGKALADLEALRIQDPTTNVVVDAAGAVSGGKSTGTLADLVEKTQLANAAAKAHGVTMQYRLQIGAAGADGTSRVQVITEPAAGAAAADIATLQLFTNTSTGRAQQIAAKATELKKIDPGSQLDILPDGRLRINAQADIGPELLAKMKPEELKALLQGTKKLSETGWSLDTLKKEDPTLYKALNENLLVSGKYRLRIDAHKTEGLKWAQEKLVLPADAKADLGILLGQADEPSLTRFFDIPNEGSQFSKKLDIDARSLAAQIALEGQPKTLGDFVNRYYHALGTLRRERLALPNKDDVVAERGILERFKGDESLRKGILAAEDLARKANVAKAGTLYIQPGATSAETVKALRAKPEELRFRETDGLTYHVRKHHHEMPRSERAGQPGKPALEVDAYMAEARKTLLEQPAGDVRSKPTQDGLGTVYTFQRPKGPVKASGKQDMSTLLVLVRFDGQAIILTYVP